MFCTLYDLFPNLQILFGGNRGYSYHDACQGVCHKRSNSLTLSSRLNTEARFCPELFEAITESRSYGQNVLDSRKCDRNFV